MNPGFNSNNREPPVRCRVRHTGKKKKEKRNFKKLELKL